MPIDTELIESYLQSDASLRAGQFSRFSAALRSAIADGRQAEARAWALRAVSPTLDYTSLLGLGRILRAAPAEASGESPLRLAVLGGPTTHQLVELLRLFLAAQGVPIELYEGDYGLFRHEILAPRSGLDAFQPQVVFLATSSRDVMRLPSLVEDDDTAVAKLLESELDSWQGLWGRIHERWGANVVQNTFDVSPWSVMGHFAVRHRPARENFLDQLNRRFAELAPAFVALHDLRSLALEAGAHEWFDPRYYLEAKLPCSPRSLVSYAHSASSLLLAIRGKSKKLLVLDLDNTVWGGVVADVGPEGIEYGQGSAQGEAFVQLHEFARGLRSRGILLAVCSKNDERVARLPFEQRDDMLLRLPDFACFVANWRNKADNLREIAQTLSLGTDAIVFVDDNPAERALVRRFLPEVAVPDLPEDPAGYVHAICRHRYFETVSWTREDTNRAAYYAQERQRTELAGGSSDMNAFLASLEMRASVAEVNELNIQRVAQLVNKTNQFNLTTLRRTQAEVEQFVRQPDVSAFAISARDRLGDSGLIAVVLLRQEGAELAVDTWLMSCRVLQRGIEDLTLNEIVRVCRERGCARIRGSYLASERNAMVRDLYPRLGFAPAGGEGKNSFWTLDVDESLPPRATHIEVERAHG